MTPPSPKPNSVLAFRSLALELGGANAGEYDGEQVDVNFGVVKTAVIAYHESIHETLSYSTPDGFLIRLFISTPKLPPVFAESGPRWLEQSVEPHEAAATYLSIKVLDPNEQYAVIDQLPKLYRGYYALLADAIDQTHAMSSYLQYIIGFSVCSIAFRSTFIEQLRSADWSRPLPRSPHHRPDVRLRRLLAAMATLPTGHLAALAQKAAESACAQAGIAPWDIQSEEAWLKNRDNSHIVEPPVFQVLIRHLAETAGVEILALDAEHACYRALSPMLAEYGLHIQLLPPDASHAERIQTEARIDGYHQASSVVSNPNCGAVDAAEDAALDAEIMFDAQLQVAIHSPSAPADARRWVFSLIAADDTTGARRIVGTVSFGQEATFNWLQRREEMSRKQQEAPLMLAFTVGVEDPNELNDLCDRLRQAITTPEDTRWPPWTNSACCWYLHSNLLNWVSHLTGETSIRLHQFRIQIDPSDEDPVFGRNVGGLAAVMIRCDPVPGAMLRILNFRAFAKVGRCIDELRQRGGIEKSSQEEQKVNSSMYYMAGDQIFAYWPEF